MTSSNESTTLVCLFHHDDQARAAVEDLYGAGIPRSLVSVIGGASSGNSGSGLETLGVPERDLKHLQEGIADGGTIVAVSATPDYLDAVEDVFGRHQATKIDEDTPRNAMEDASLAAAAGRGPTPKEATEAVGERTIPVIEEELQVGKRTVDRGGVRIYRRVVEIPAEQSINLREEHVVVERNAVDRAATPADLEGQGNRSIELKETAEEAVISKNARVIEEVVIGKEVEEHTQHIQEKVRRTEVEVEELPVSDRRATSKVSY